MILQWEILLTVAPTTDRNNIHKFSYKINTANSVEAVELLMQFIQEGGLSEFMSEPKIKEIIVMHQPSEVTIGVEEFSLIEGGGYKYGN